MSDGVTTYEVGDQPVPGFELKSYLGGGMIGQVWKATSPGGVEVALKIVTGLDQLGARKEFKSLQQIKNINHPNLTKIFGFWVKDENGNILAEDVLAAHQAEMDSSLVPQLQPEVLELQLRDTLQTSAVDTDVEQAPLVTRKGFDTSLSGSKANRPAQLIIAMALGDKTLLDRLEECQQGQPVGKHRGIPVDELLSYMWASAKALDFLNVERRLLHCDVKPQNILVVSGEAQVCDFGLAKKVEGLRKTTTRAYTPYYAAPEVVVSGQYGPRVDQYSLAVTYAELRTGRVPYEHESVAHVYQAKVTGELDLADLPPAERKVIAKATALDPRQRYESLTAMVRDLEEAVHPRPAAVRKRHWVRDGILMVVLLVAVVVAIVMLLQGDKGMKGKFQQDLADANFTGAYDTLNRVSTGREELLGQLHAHWLKAIREQATAQPEAAFESAVKLTEIKEFAPAIKDQARKLQLEILQARLQAGDQLLASPGGSAEDLAAAKQQYDKTLSLQGSAESSSPEFATLAAWSRLGQIRIKARQKNVDWQEIRTALAGDAAVVEQLNPPVRGNWYALMALAEGHLISGSLLDNADLAAAIRQAGTAAEVAPWEQQRMDALKKLILAEFLAKYETLSEATVNRWKEALGENFEHELRLAEAGSAAGKSKYAEAREILEQLEKLAAGRPALLQRVLTQRAVVDLADDTIALEIVVPWLADHRTQLQDVERDGIGRLLLARVERQLADQLTIPALRQAVALCDELRTSTSATERRAMDLHYARLLALQTLRQPELLSMLREQLPGGLEAFPAAEAPLVTMASLEAELLESVDSSSPSSGLADRLQEARDALPDDAPPYVQHYAEYLKALMDQAEALKVDQTADVIVRTIRSESWMFSGPRSVYARDILLRVALLRLPSDRHWNGTQPLAAPAVVLDWTETLVNASLEPTQLCVVARVLALAYASGDAPPWEQVAAAAEQLLGSSSDLKSFQQQQRLSVLRLASARAHADRFARQAERSDLNTAVARFGETLDALYQWAGPPVDRVLQTNLQQWLIDPAIAMVKGPDASQPRVTPDSGLASGEAATGVAKLYAARGRLLEWQHAADPSFEVLKEQYEAFREANRWHETSESLVAEGRALYKLIGFPQWRQQGGMASADAAKAMKSLAQRALTLSSDASAEGWGLLCDGYHLTGVTTCPTAQQARIDAFDASIESYSEALQPQRIELFAERRAEWLIGRSASRVQRSFLSRTKQQDYLNAAVEDARQAVLDGNSLAPEESQNAMGNALEDVAYYVLTSTMDLQAAEQHYVEAIGAFETAISESLESSATKAKSLMNLGRCRFRLAERLRSEKPNDSQVKTQVETLLQEAETNLRQADTFAQRALDYPQIHYWLSHVYLLKHQLKLGENSLSDAETFARQAANASSEMGDATWVKYQLMWIDCAHFSGDYQAVRERCTAILSASAKDEGCNPVSLDDTFRVLARIATLTNPGDRATGLEDAETLLKNAQDTAAKHLIAVRAFRALLQVNNKDTTVAEIQAIERQMRALADELAAKVADARDRALLQPVLDGVRGVALVQMIDANATDAASRDKTLSAIQPLQRSVSGFNELGRRLPQGIDLADYLVRSNLGMVCYRLVQRSKHPNANISAVWALAAGRQAELRQAGIDALEPVVNNQGLPRATRDKLSRLLADMRRL